MLTLIEILKAATKYSVYASVIIGLLVLFIKTENKAIQCIKIYFVVMALLESYSYYVVKSKQTTLFLFDVYTFLEISLIGITFYYLLKKDLKKATTAKIIIIVSSISLVLLLTNTFYYKFFSNSTVIASIPVLVFCFIIFYNMLEVEIDNMLPIALVVYLFLIHGVSLLIYIFFEPILQFSKTQSFVIFLIRAIVYILVKFVVAAIVLKIGFLKKPKLTAHE